MLEFELVLPAHNEACSLPILLRNGVAAAQSAGYSNETFQIVLVDNGSTDNTPEVLRSLSQGELQGWFRSLHVPINHGYGNGLWVGLQTTVAPFVGWSHSDLQCDLSHAFTALEMLRAAPSLQTLVKGVRQGRMFRDRLMSRVFEMAVKFVLGVPYREINAQPKIFRRELLQRIGNPPQSHAFDLYVLFQACRAGYELRTLPVDFPPRRYGVSSWAHGFVSRVATIAQFARYLFHLARTEGRLR